jgi:hypothetical protein
MLIVRAAGAILQNYNICIPKIADDAELLAS